MGHKNRTLSTDALQGRTKKRQPLLAALLSLIWPGLGQLYNTRPRRGLVLLAIVLGLSLIFSGLMMTPPVHWVVLVLLVGILVLGGLVAIVACVDAALGARRIGKVALRRYNRGYVYVGIAVSYGLLTIAWQSILEEFRATASYSIPSESHLPTLHVGDYVVAWKNYYRDHAPERGDLVVFKLPRDNSTVYIKRLIGLPGDRIMMREGALFINDKPVKRERVEDFHYRDGLPPIRQYCETLPNGVSYNTLDLKPGAANDNTRVFSIPPGHYFVLGDNRDNSLDSRVERQRGGVGLVPLENLHDRSMFIYGSKDRSWIGTQVQSAC